MTSNQINLMKSREERRHNKATEKETERSNRRAQAIAVHTLEETKRRNLAQENIATQTLEETKRRNLAQENIDRDRNAETGRHNLATESFNQSSFQQTLNETGRHNLATEHQALLNYGLEKERVYNTALQTEISRYAAETNRLSQIESARHNLATESLQATLNNQNYELATKSNALKQMDITQSNLLKYQSQEEQKRHNTAMEAETYRHNIENERLDQKRQATSVLTNVSDQANKWYRSIKTKGQR